MPILPGEPPAGRPASRTDFVTWWLPEFALSAGCVCAGLLLWGPFAAIAVVPLLRPAAEAVQLVELARREAEADRARAVAESVFTDLQLPAAPQPPVAARAERLDRREITAE